MRKGSAFRFFKYNKNNGTYQFYGWLTLKIGNEDKLDWDNMTKEQVDIFIKFMLSIKDDFGCSVYKTYTRCKDIYLKTTSEFEKNCLKKYNQITNK